MQNEIHIRAQRGALGAFGHHAAQFSNSAAGPSVAEARLTADEAVEMLNCLGFRVGPSALDTDARELHDEAGALVGIIFAPATVIDAAAFRFRRELRQATQSE